MNGVGAQKLPVAGVSSVFSWSYRCFSSGEHQMVRSYDGGEEVELFRVQAEAPESASSKGPARSRPVKALSSRCHLP